MQKQNGIRVDSVRNNFLYQTSYQLLSLALPFITAPYIARVLGTTGTGIYSYASSILFFFTMVANLGISNYGNREIAASIDDRETMSRTFWGIYFCHALCSLLCIAAYYVYTFFFVYEYKEVFLWQSFQMWATLFDITWFFSGIQIFKITVRRNTIIRVLTVVAIFSFVKSKDDTWKYIAILAIGNFIGQIVVWTHLRKYIDFIFISTKEIIKHMKPMVLLFIPVLAMSIYRYMDKVMIPHFSNMSELGLYENAERLIALPLSLITTVGVVLLPKMSSIAARGDIEERNRYFNMALKYSLIFAFGLSGGLAGVSETFTPLFFGNDFIKCGELIALLSITVPLLTWSNSIRSQYLIPNKKDSAFIVAAFCGAIINLIFNMILISKFGARGATYATIMAEFVVAVVHTLYSYKELQFIQIIKRSLPFIIPALIMTVIVRTIGILMKTSILTVIVQVAMGAFFYLISIIIILNYQKDEYFRTIGRSIINRIKK